MAIPDYQTLMRPALAMLATKDSVSVAAVAEKMADEFALTAEERQRLLPSGTQLQLRNRVNWALFYLKRAGALDSPRRGMYRITPRGRSLLESHPERIDGWVLEQFPEFVAFKLKTSATPTDGIVRGIEFSETQPFVETLTADTASDTPEELIANAHAQLNAQLASDLLEKIKAATPAFFESLVVDLLLALGYGGSLEDAGQVRGRSGDEGIDGVIKEDRLGLDTIYIQAKKWESSVGRPEIQKFAGALQGQRARKGVFITTGPVRTFVC